MYWKEMFSQCWEISIMCRSGSGLRPALLVGIEFFEPSRGKWRIPQIIEEAKKLQTKIQSKMREMPVLAEPWQASKGFTGSDYECERKLLSAIGSKSLFSPQSYVHVTFLSGKTSGPTQHSPSSWVAIS